MEDFSASQKTLSLGVSAISGKGITELRKLIAEEVKKIHIKIYPNYIQHEVY